MFILLAQQLIDIGIVIVLLAAADAESLTQTFDGDFGCGGVGLGDIAIVKITDVVGVGAVEPQTGKKCECSKREEGEWKQSFP